jgi:hypothetical protein
MCTFQQKNGYFKVEYFSLHYLKEVYHIQTILWTIEPHDWGKSSKLIQDYIASIQWTL